MHITKKIVLASCLSSLMTTTVYAGSEIATLIKMLHENGTVSDEQYGRLLAELQQAQQQSQQEKQVINNKLAEATNPSDIDVKIKEGGLTLATRDGAFTTKLGGRLQLDAASYSGNPEMGDGTEVRRAYLTLQGTMYDDWGYRFQYNFASTGSNGKGILDAFIDYKGFDSVDLRVGNFKEPFTLQEAISDNFTTFTERATIAAFSPGRRMGVMASHGNQDWTWAAGVFGDSVDSKGGTDDESWGASTRVTMSPINQAGRLVHLGLGANYRNVDSAGSVQFKQAPETHIAGINIVDTGSSIMNANDVLKLGAEFATVYGPFSAQAEYIATNVARDGLNDLDFDGWYAQAGYFLTGESQQYSKGKFGSPKPNSIVGQGGIGAWQLALRYNTLDLNDGLINGGDVDAMTLGLNWYSTPALRFTANYVDVLEVDGGPNDEQEPRVFQVRSQWAF